MDIPTEAKRHWSPPEFSKKKLGVRQILARPAHRQVGIRSEGLKRILLVIFMGRFQYSSFLGLDFIFHSGGERISSCYLLIQLR